MPLIKDDVEMVGELRLPLGGLNGYVNVRQGGHVPGLHTEQDPTHLT